MKAIVTGVSGQDGYFMTRLLLDKGMHVIGLTSNVIRARMEYAGVPSDKLTIRGFDYLTANKIADILHQYEPDLIFNFAAKSTGEGMFDRPDEMKRLNGDFPFEILEAIRNSERLVKMTYVQASSSEMFGDVRETPQDETTAFRPKSPYGAAKLYAHNMIGIYRDRFGIRCGSAILFNHESVRRSTQFVTKKIANGAARIKKGIDKQLELGSLSIQRDWGYAPDYMEALYAMASADKVSDYVVATGKLSTIRDVAEVTFSHLGLNYQDYVTINPAWVRATDTVGLRGDASKINKELGWSSNTSFRDMFIEMVSHEMEILDAELAR